MPANNPLSQEHLATEHEIIYPRGDGEGAAGDPIAVTTDSQDETNGAATKNDFWGEPMVLLAPATVTTAYSFVGVNFSATTVNQRLRLSLYRVLNATAATRNAGNAWDQAATVLTLNSTAAAEKFIANDLVWITSSAYKPNGEIQKVASQTGATVTLVRETVNAGANDTGLRWNHTTNVGGGTLKIYRCYRLANTDEHVMHFDFVASTAKDEATERMHAPRSFLANDGLIIRSQNATGDTTALVDVAIIRHD